MNSGTVELAEFIDAAKQDLLAEPVDEFKAPDVQSWRVRFREVDFTLRGVPAMNGDGPSVQLRFDFSGDDLRTSVLDADLPVEHAARLRLAEQWRAFMKRFQSLQGVIENALQEAVRAGGMPPDQPVGESPWAPLGWAEGVHWIDLYLEASHRAGQSISTTWLHAIDLKLAGLSDDLLIADRLRLSHRLWTVGAQYIENSRLVAASAGVPEEFELPFPEGITNADPGTTVHRDFLKRALVGCNVVRAHQRPWPAEAVALIEHAETQCAVKLTVRGQSVEVRFEAMVKQGWIGKEVPPVFGYEECITLTDLADEPFVAELGRRLQAMDQGWSSWKSIAKTAEAEVSGKQRLFRQGRHDRAQWVYFYVLAQALGGRKVTPQWIENVSARFADWMAMDAGPEDSLIARYAGLAASEAAHSAGLIAMAGQQGVIPTYRPHAFADRTSDE
jgi:hypothetical protein